MKIFLICVLTIISSSNELFGQSDSLLESVKLLVMQEYVDSSITFIQNDFRIQGIDLCESQINEIKEEYGMDSVLSLDIDFGEHFKEVQYPFDNIDSDYVAYISEIRNGVLLIRVYDVKLLNEIGLTWSPARQYTFNLDSTGSIKNYCVGEIEH